MSQFYNMGPFNPVNFRGNGKATAVPIFIDKLPVMLGGLAGPNAKFGRVVSVAPTAARKFLIGTAAGRIVRGILVADPNIMANDPAMNDLYYEGRPATVVTFGPVEISRYDLTQAAPTLGSKVMFNDTTGEIAFVSSAAAIPGGYTQLNAHVLDVDLPNGVSIWLDIPAVAITSTPLSDVATPAVVNTPAPSGGTGAVGTPYLVTSGHNVKASCATPGATIVYTLDGSAPTMESPVFPAAGLTLTATVNLRMYAFKEGMDPSALANVYYTVS